MLAPTCTHHQRRRRRRPGQIAVAGDRCRNHQSPAAPCSRIRFVLMCRQRSQQARKSRAPAGWRARGACWEIFAASGGRSITPADSDWDEAENFKRASEWQLQPVTDSPAETRDSWRDGEDPVKEAGDPAIRATSGSWKVLYQSSEVVPVRKSLSGSDGCQVKSLSPPSLP